MKKPSNIIIISEADGISRIKLNEPETYNALSYSTLKSLIDAFNFLNIQKKTKVIILEGKGKGFSAGHNLKEIKSLKKKKEYKKLFNLCSKLMLTIVEGNKPVIAKVHGAAFAAGCQLVASCDLAISADDAIFATPGVNIGLFCSTPMVAVSRKVNRKNVMQMLLTGEYIKADYAKEKKSLKDYKTFELWINGEYVKSCSHNFPLINKKTLKESNSKGYKDSGKVDFRYGIYRPNVGKWLMSNNKNHPQKLEYFRDPDGGETVVKYPFKLNWENKIPTSIIYYDEMRIGKSKDEVDITMQSKPVD